MRDVTLKDPLGKHSPRTVRVGSTYERTLRLLGWTAGKAPEVTRETSPAPAEPAPAPAASPTEAASPEPSPAEMTLAQLSDEMETRDQQAEETPFRRGRSRYSRRDFRARE